MKSTMKMKTRILSAVLSFCMIVTFLPGEAFAASGTTSSGKLIISDKSYEIAPDIVEREYITNNANLTAQQMGHVMEVKLGGNAQIIAGYNDYNIEDLRWGMRRTTEQAEYAENNRDPKAKVNVVGAVNGDFFNMSNGQPTGVLVMNGTMIQNTNRPCFYIDKDDVPHITSNSANLPEGVKEAIGGAVVLVAEGQPTGVSDSTTNPRTAIGIRADNTVVIYMVDGRQAPLSVGMNYDELTQTMMDLGCVWALNLDGGGSSTFATQRAGDPDNETAGLTLRCSPSDGYERTVSSSLLVVSSAASDGVFDHAVVSPNQEIYTPGSTIQFTAQGADQSGAAADLPANDLSWSIMSGSHLGTIDAATGIFTGAEGKTGTVEVGLTYNGKTVGQTSVELQWPDKLGFANNSVSLDFGKEDGTDKGSDLSFSPTYQGREVHYKDGDFTWFLDATYYKHTALVDPKSENTQGDFSMAITPDTLNKDTVVVEYYKWGSSLTYSSTFRVTELIPSENGTEIGAKLHLVEAVTGNDRVPQAGRDKSDKLVTFSLGKFENNRFFADKDNSLRGKVTVALSENSSLSASVDVVVGMEPQILMDFEDKKVKDEPDIPAKDYWNVHVGTSSDTTTRKSDGKTLAFANSALTVDEVKSNRLWIRDTTGKGVVWPKDEDGNELNGIVSAENNSNVRFGNYAYRLAWDFQSGNINEADVAAADFGFSGDLKVASIQPTKIGMWINVPKECSTDNSILKAVLKGAAYEASDKKPEANTAYMEMNSDGSISYVDGKELTGTAAYVQYYSYNTDGTVSGQYLKDWADKGWTWVEADISAYQMPVDVCRAYTVRVTSPQKSTKQKHYVYLDNIQFIYGTNTNDINNPVIESVIERSSGINLKTSEERSIFTNKTVAFEVPISDNKQTDKYASGIDGSSIKVYVDGRDYTSASDLFSMSETEYGTNVLFQTPELTNGQHSLKIRAKDFYGNETVETYSFIIDDEAGKPAAVTVRKQEKEASPGGTVLLDIVNNGESAASIIEATIEVTEEYAAGFKKDIAKSLSYGECYEQAKEPLVQEDGKITVYAQKKAGETGDSTKIATLSFEIPGTVRKGEKFTYSVPEASYSNGVNTETFSLENQDIPYTAAYEITVGHAIVDMPIDITVTDTEGNPVEGAKLYTSDGNELTSTIFKSEGLTTIYAKSDDGKRSWNCDFTICKQTTEGGGFPFGIQNNASSDGSSQRNITWLSAIGSSEAKALIRLSQDQNKVESTERTTGDSGYMTFSAESGNALRMNSVKLTGLEADTTYYYQVGDGEKWSEVLSFTTAPGDKGAETNFFIFGDIQTSSTDRLDKAIENIVNSEKRFSFGIQTGDAIDGVNKFSEWQGYMTTMNGKTLNGIDVFHTMGNHEYYGDAEGDIAGTIFGIENREEGAFNTAEYGSIYVAVINDGGDLIRTLERINAEALKSNCAWKVLSIHKPIYGTNEEKDAESRIQITKLIEEAGFDFVFSGDDHAYARTYPMLGDVAQAENSQEGVVYYICGDLSSKSNAFTKYNYFAEAIPHVNYTGMYMSVEADGEKIILNAYDYNGNLLDSYTKTKTDCELGNHTFDNNTLYDLTTKTLQCKICGEDVSAAESKYTGKLETKGGEGEVILAGGTVKTGWFTWLEDICHAGDDGLLHRTTTIDTATCTEDGRIVATCEDCNKTYTGAYTYGKGHTWDAKHVCTICKTVGISMDKVTLKLNGKYWEYRGSGIRAAVDATYGDYKLTASSDRYGRDAFISYSNNIDVGMGTVTFDGRGDFYGTKSIEFPIVPKSVTEITAGEVLSTKAIIRWDEAAGAGYYRVYKKTSGTDWELAGTTSNTSIIVSDLQPETEYIFRIGSSTDVAGETFNGLHWSNELNVTTEAKSDQNTEDHITGIRAVIDANGSMVEIPMVKKDGMNYLLLPSSAALNALQLDLTMTDNSREVTYIGTAETQTVTGPQATVNVASLSGKQTGTHQIMLTLPDCEPMTLSIMKSENIPAMYLTSDDSVGQGRDYVDASKSNEATAQMTMIGPGGNAIYSGALTQLKARGNSTFTYYDKKSYQIKLKTRSDLVGSGEEVKTWVLLAGYGDATQMHDKLVKDMASTLGMPYVASSDWVDLYYDGEYRGTYLLSEKNGVNSTSVNITDMEDAYEEKNEGYGDNMQTATGTNVYGQEYQYTTGLTEPDNITGGYLIERNLNTIDEASGFYTREGGGFNVKSPEFAGEEAMKYISEYYQEFEDAVFAQDEEGNYTGFNAETEKYYYEYCDKESLVKVFLLQELAFNADGFLSSFYFYKDVNGIMYAGPVWDQEMTFGTSWSRNNSADGDSRYYLARALYQIPDFKEAVDEYYASEFEDQAKGLLGESGTIAGYNDKISASTAMNYVLWPYVKIGSPSASGHLWAAGTTYSDVVTDMIQWITKRLVKLNEIYGDGSEHVEHVYTSQVTKEPTYEEEGVRTYTCTVCGDTYTESIPKLTRPDVGGGGGGIALPPTAEDNVTNQGTTNTDNAVTNAEITPTTSTSGTVNAVVDQITADKLVDKAVKHNSVEIVIDAAGGKDNVNTAAVVIPTKTIDQLVEKTNAAVTVKTDAGEMTFDKKAVAAIADQAEGDELKIIVEKTKDETAEMNFELKVVSGGTVIGDFHGGKVKVTVKLNKALNEKKVTCVYKDDDGFVSKVGGKKNENGTYTFTTNHFSTYIIMAEEEADQLIADQATDVKNTKIGLRSSLVKLKGGKKAVKLVWYAKDGSKLNLEGVEIFRSVKKKSGYGVKPIFTTTKEAYYNTAVKVGTRYYYKVRGYKMIGDVKVYTDWSGKAWRIVK